ncbi:MAG TPA: hypothetical protein VF534_27260 [Paraburkholderia sp.]
MNAPVGVRKYVDGRLVSGGVPAHLDTASEPYDDDDPPAVVALPTKRQADDEITDTNGLRKFLLKQMVAASKGELDSERTRNVCALVQQIYQATKLELEAARILQDGTKSIRAIDLTTDD